jgi:uncharacterized protein (DUF58 family)
MVPTQLVYGLLIVGTLLSLAIMVLFRGGLELAILVALVWDVLVVFLAVLDSGLVNPRHVEIKRELPSKLSIGRENAVILTLATTQKSAQLQITDHYPSKLQVETLPRSLSLEPKAQQSFSYMVTPTQREVLTWGAIQVRQLGRLGLAWRQWTVEQPQTTAVYPDLIALRELTIRLALQSTGSSRLVRRQGMGTEFAELRDYVSGDDPRLIDWKATARRGQPLVRVLEPEQEQTLLILLDRGRLMTAKVEGLLRFDWGLNSALALAKAALYRGDRVGIGVFDRQMTVWIPPGRGDIQMGRFLETLTPIQPDLIEPDYLGAVSSVITRQTRRALVVVLTDVVDSIASAELLGALSRLAPRYLPFCVALRDPYIDSCAKASTDTVSLAYSRAVALDLLAQRQVALGQLKQQGVLVLDAPANQISSPLVDQYLKLKARNRL